MKIYISCPIRGIHVNSETYGTLRADKIVRQNCSKAMAVADTLRKHLLDADVHCPANWNLETFVNKAYTKGYITEKQILDIDCDIIADSDFVLFYNHEGEFGRGMQVEYDFVIKYNIRFGILYDAKQLPDYIGYLREIGRIKDGK